jgi:predicted AlkP superfamily phosphohydrolase/phosphomutase
MEPTLAEKYMAEGKLPNLSKLKEQGTFTRLGTTLPPLSPVAWSTFLTGCNPGKHNIFDFLTRDRRNYLPALSSVSIRGASRTLKLGSYRIPLGRPDIRLLRRGKPFWNVLGEHGIFSNIIRVPITFPPERLRGVLLSAMCVPDLRGSQGTFSYYTTGAERVDEYIGGERVRVNLEGNVIRSYLVGPENTINGDGGPMRCPLEIRITRDGEAELQVCGQTHKLRKGQYTPWVRVAFKPGLGIKVRGICQFLLLNTDPDFELYVTPIQIDPDKPALPISHPAVYSCYLSKMHGLYATLGLAEDTWGLNCNVLDDDTFLHQCLEADAEREQMFFDALAKVRRGLCVCVFDGTDRIQHMFWRYIDPQHPAYNGQAKEQHRNAIEELYVRMDALVGRTMQACNDDETVLMVLSDHGFGSFRRGIDLNVWLERNGYLTLKPDGRGKKYLAGVDWSRTRAYCLGLAGMWLNISGRESQGIVDPGDADTLRDELCEKLSGLRDDEKDEVAITRAFNARKIYRGPYSGEGPDVIIGYNRGYRVSWEAAVGQPTDGMFHDNRKAWSGDHCMDPRLVPGVLFCNRRVDVKDKMPRLMDIGPTVLDMFGVAVPSSMDGRPLVVGDADVSVP